jgi:hypothetical protein
LNELVAAEELAAGCYVCIVGLDRKWTGRRD